MDNTTQAFVQGGLGTDSFICDRDKALEELSNLKTIIEDLRGYIASDLENDLAAFHDIKGFIGGTEVKEDNLFYDINVDGVFEESGKGEHYDDTFVGYPDAVANTLEAIADKIQNHIDAYDYYSHRTEYPDFVRKMMERLKGSKTDLKLTLDDLTTCSREEILEKYGLTAEDLAKNPDEMEFASEEEKQAYFEALEYFNQEFAEDQRLYSVGKAEDYANTLALAEVTETAASSTSTTTSSDATETTAKKTDSSVSTTTSENNNATSVESSSSSSNSESISGGESSSSSSGGGSTQGSTSYRRTSSTSIPEVSNVESSSISEHQSEMQAATKKAQNTTAFDERNAYEERIAAEEKAQDEANKAQAAKDEADQAAKVAEQNKTTSTEAKTTTTETTSTNTDTSSTTTVETKPTTSEPVSTVAETTTVQPVENVAPVNTQPVTQTGQTTQAASTVSTTVPEIKDMISNGKTATTTQATTTKADPSKMVSSVTSNSTPLKPITIDDTSTKTETTSTAGKFVPPIAGISTAAVAGLGAKLYIDKKDKKDEKKEEKSENKFFNDNIEP